MFKSPYTKSPNTMFLAITLLFIAIVIALKSFSKTIFFFRMIKKGLINPNHEDLVRINLMLKDKKNHLLFSVVFKEILFLQIKIFLKKSAKKEKFISGVNFVLKSINRYYFNRVKLRKRMGVLLHKQDLFIQKKIYSYGSHKPWPMVELMKNLSKIRKVNPNLLSVSFKAGQDVIIKLIGEPMVRSELFKFALDKRLVRKLEGLFAKREGLFLHSLSQINFAAA